MWLDLPPLAARREDIPALVAHFSDALRQRLHLPDCGREALIAHGWPGNLRELRNLVERALAHGERVLDAETIARLLHPRRRPMQDWLAAAPPAPPPAREFPMQMAAPISPMDLKALMAEAEAALIAEALAASGGTIAQSARLLGMKRTTLVEKMKRMGLKAANEAA